MSEVNAFDFTETFPTESVYVYSLDTVLQNVASVVGH